MSKNSTALVPLAKSVVGVVFFAAALFLLVPPVPSETSEPYSVLPGLGMSAAAFAGYLVLRNNMRELSRLLVVVLAIGEMLLFLSFGILIFYRSQL